MSSSTETKDNKKRLQALEAQAVAEATASADAAYTPSPSLLNASTAEPLLQQVDGPSLAEYFDEDSAAGKESVYVGRAVPIGAGGSLTIPIQINSPGSVVEYSVENKQYDFGFGITAEREEGVTIVKVQYASCFVAMFVVLYFQAVTFLLKHIELTRYLFSSSYHDHFCRKRHAWMRAVTLLRENFSSEVYLASSSFNSAMTFRTFEKRSLATRSR